MKKVVCVGIIAASVIAGYVYWQANRNVYSLNAYAGGFMAGPQWHIGEPPHWIGFSQYTEVGMPSEWGKMRNTPTFTEIDLASYQLKIKAEAWQVGWAAAAAVLALVLLSWLSLSWLLPLRRRQ